MRRQVQTYRRAGFTLVELVVVITIISIVATITAGILRYPMEGYVDLGRRAELVDAAESTLRRMQRDVRQALPNSIRLRATATVDHIEMLHTVDGGRYRAQGPGDILDFTKPDDRFDVLGPLRANPTQGDWLVVYNVAASGVVGNAYGGDNRGIIGLNATASDVRIDPAFEFPLASPNQRFFIVDEPVSYLCDSVAGTLQRVSGYTNLDPNNPPAAFAGGVSTLMADHVESCSFTYTPGTSQRAGLVTLELVLADEGERVRLLHQIHVENTP